jgi:hypothetical protein
MSEPGDHHAGCHADLDRDGLHERLDRAEHALLAMQRLIVALRELVPKAFEEGFRKRNPEVEEPWLIDWLSSETKRALDPLFGRREPPP